MISGIEGVTTAALAVALDAASMQQRVIAANIANVNTPGYMPKRLHFSAHVDGARAFGGAAANVDPASMLAVRMALEPARDAAGVMQSVKPDQEVAAMSANALHYQALATALNKHFSIIASAVSDGKR